MTKAELYQKACMLPLLPGVYIIRDKSDTIIYIGKAKRLRIRVSQYFREGVPHDNKVSQMIAHAYAFDVIVCQSEFEALVLEASQIKAHTPKYNILLKDDKGYSYIKVTREAWPRLSFVLQKEEDDAEYIGPYTSSFAARQMAETAMDAFLLPRCSKRFPQDIGKGRPCLNAHIGKCMAVCSGKISCENYNQAVKNAVHLIRYGKKDILKILNERMLEASDRLEFETAALLRDQINAITKVTAGQKVVVDPEVEMDVVALAGTPSSVCAAVLRFREGRLTDKREFLFHDTADIAAVREEFLPRYYLDDEQIPKIIAVDELPPDSEALQRALNEKRGSEVQLYVPQRGDKAHLVEMAHTNAVERLARESGRYAREEKLLDEMAQVLGLSKPPRTIESYDISNWGDGTSVCGMVTFRDGKPYKAGYRKFRMKTLPVWQACPKRKSRPCSMAAGTAFRGRCSPSGGTTRGIIRTSAGPMSLRPLPSPDTGRSTGGTISVSRSRSRWGGMRRTRRAGFTASRSCTAARAAPTRACASIRWSRQGGSGRQSRTTRCSRAAPFWGWLTLLSLMRAGARALPP